MVNVMSLQESLEFFCCEGRTTVRVQDTGGTRLLGILDKGLGCFRSHTEQEGVLA